MEQKTKEKISVDYYEPTVEKYIAADRKTFISPQYWIPLPSAEKSTSGIWVDVVAINTSDRYCYLCEISFSRQPREILRKIVRFETEMRRIQDFLTKTAVIAEDWGIRPWLFILQATAHKLISRLPPNHVPKITYLEYTAPWFYPNGFRGTGPGKPYDDMPVGLQ